MTNVAGPNPASFVRNLFVSALFPPKASDDGDGCPHEGSNSSVSELHEGNLGHVSSCFIAPQLRHVDYCGGITAHALFACR